MSVIRTVALVLRHLPDREFDRQLVVLTPGFGQQRLRARGTKKSTAKLTGSLEPIAEVDLLLANGRRNDVVTGGVVVERFSALRQDVIALVAAQWLAELVERVAKPGQPTEALYALVRAAWHGLAADATLPVGRRWLRLCRWAWHILALEGFAPSIDQCATCHRPLNSGGAAYQPGRGIVHRDEAPPGARQIAQDSLDFLRQDVAADQRQVFVDVHRLLEAVLHHALDRPLRSEPVLRQVMRSEQLSAR